jgi:hypothetical protein
MIDKEETTWRNLGREVSPYGMHGYHLALPRAYGIITIDANTNPSSTESLPAALFVKKCSRDLQVALLSTALLHRFRKPQSSIRTLAIA